MLSSASLATLAASFYHGADKALPPCQQRQCTNLSETETDAHNGLGMRISVLRDIRPCAGFFQLGSFAAPFVGSPCTCRPSWWWSYSSRTKPEYMAKEEKETSGKTPTLHCTCTFGRLRVFRTSDACTELDIRITGKIFLQS